MKFTTILGAAAMTVPLVSAGYNPLCDAYALLSITLKLCDTDIYVSGHFDPLKACTCWHNHKGSGLLLGYELDLVQIALGTCTCVALGL